MAYARILIIEAEGTEETVQQALRAFGPMLSDGQAPPAAASAPAVSPAPHMPGTPGPYNAWPERPKPLPAELQPAEGREIHQKEVPEPDVPARQRYEPDVEEPEPEAAPVNPTEPLRGVDLPFRFRQAAEASAPRPQDRMAAEIHAATQRKRHPNQHPVAMPGGVDPVGVLRRVSGKPSKKEQILRLVAEAPRSRTEIYDLLLDRDLATVRSKYSAISNLVMDGLVEDSEHDGRPVLALTEAGKELVRRCPSSGE